MRPNWIQWVIIWVAVLIAAHLWLHLRLSDFADDGQGGWGAAGYLHRAMLFNDSRARAPYVVLGIGALLAWQASGWHKGGSK